MQPLYIFQRSFVYLTSWASLLWMLSFFFAYIFYKIRYFWAKNFFFNFPLLSYIILLLWYNIWCVIYSRDIQCFLTWISTLLLKYTFARKTFILKIGRPYFNFFFLSKFDFYCCKIRFFVNFLELIPAIFNHCTLHRK